MNNIFLFSLGLAYTALGLYCMIAGNPGWMVSLGLRNWMLPTLLTIPGVGLLVVSLVFALAKKAGKSTAKA